MNRTTLLHVLDHATGISEAEVRELEQLAAAFPYCQTAHLLLAKAAHDRGSMLASQRLRRAATYAVDRELLRHLIELPVSTTSVAAASLVAAGMSAAEEATDLLATNDAAAALVGSPSDAVAEQLVPKTTEHVAPAPEAENADPVGQRATDFAEPAVVTTSVAEADGADGTTDFFEASPAAESPIAPAAAEQPELADNQSIATASSVAVEAAFQSSEAADTDSDPQVTADSVAAEPVSLEPAPTEELAAISVAEFQPAAAPEDVDQSQAAVEAEPTVPASEFELTAQEAPETEITTPAPADETAIFEIAGEVETDSPTAATSEVTDTDSDNTTAATTVLAAPGSVEVVAAGLPAAAGMAPEAADELPPTAPPIRPPVEAGSSRFEFGLGETPIPTTAYQLPELPEDAPATDASIPPFHADELLAYALSGSSRFGAALTLRDAELTTDLPLDADWHPDAVGLAHLAANRPAPAPTPSSLALIEKFLRSQPRIKSAATRPAPTDSPQADLSVRSTSAAPSLASESLAKIMVRQGKVGRAIEIYEQLMQRQPEKKAYFAAQIDLLNQQPE